MSTADDKAKAALRTVWPYAVGGVATYVVQAADWLHLPVDEPAAQLAASFIVGSAVWWAGSRLSRVRGTGSIAGLARFLGRVLVSAGVTTGQPVYVKPGQDRYDALR